MFKRLPNTIDEANTITFTIEGKEYTVVQGDSVAAVMLVAGFIATRTTTESGQARGPYCMMGTCFDCLVEINGIPNQRACQTIVQEGMRVFMQEQAGSLNK